MEADAAGVAHIADRVGLLPIAMSQTCQPQISASIALDKVAAVEPGSVGKAKAASVISRA